MRQIEHLCIYILWLYCYIFLYVILAGVARHCFVNRGNAAMTKTALRVSASDNSISEDSAIEPIASDAARSTLLSRNITVKGRRTSIRLEPEMWSALREAAKREHCTVHDICSLISVRKNARTSLTSAIRVFLMLYYRAASTEEGHKRAGHGSFRQMMQRARLPVQMESVSRYQAPQHV